jgi:hypothetical protein
MITPLLRLTGIARANPPPQNFKPNEFGPNGHRGAPVLRAYSAYLYTQSPPITTTGVAKNDFSARFVPEVREPSQGSQENIDMV